MKFHLFQPAVIGRPSDIEAGMAGQRRDLFQRYLDEIKQYVQRADELGYASYGHPEHHLQIEGLEITNHPGMFSLFIGLHSQRLKAGCFGYVLPTHNPVRAAEEIATLDHMLGGRLLVGFNRGYQARWVDSYAAVPQARATSPELAKSRDEQDAINREIFEESLKIVKLAWASETFSHKGKYWCFPPEEGSAGHPAYAEFGRGMDPEGRVREIGIAPRCFQDPHPPLYGAFAHSMRTIRMWGREGGKPIVLASDLDFCETLQREYRKAAQQAGRDIPPDDVAAWGGLLIIADTAERAQQLREAHDWHYRKWIAPYGLDFWTILIGTPDEISRQIERAHQRLRFNEMFLEFGQGLLPPEVNLEQIERFATEIAPRFSTKDETGTLV